VGFVAGGLAPRECAYWPDPEAPDALGLLLVQRGRKRLTFVCEPGWLRAVTSTGGLASLSAVDLEGTPAVLPTQTRGWPKEWGKHRRSHLNRMRQKYAEQGWQALVDSCLE
jgi:hypothetical protein